MGNDLKYYQFEPGAFLEDMDFQIMSVSQRGIYISLILYLYRNNGKLPNDDRTLFKLCNSDAQTFDSDWEQIKHKFICNEYIEHKRVTEEIEKASNYYKKKRIAGQKSGESRRNKAQTQPEHTLNTVRTQPELSKAKVSKEKNLRFNKKILPKVDLALAKKAMKLQDTLDVLFGPLTPTQETTFIRIVRYVKKELGAAGIADLEKRATESANWASRNRKDKETAAKCFVKKVYQETGLEKQEKIL